MTSSGTTTGLETYEFDNKASSISIAAIFSGPGQSITISEVRETLLGYFVLREISQPLGVYVVMIMSAWPCCELPDTCVKFLAKPMAA